MKNFIQNKLSESLINEVDYLDKNNKGVDKIRVYHGITSDSMLNNLLKRGLSGSEIIKRVNSNETANDNGLFVTTDFDFAKNYAKSGRIIEFTVKNSDLISVTDGVSKSFNWGTPQDNLLSDKPEALFIGDLNPNMINSVWVLEHNKWVKLSRKEYIRKYNPNVKKSKLDMFLPTDDLDFGYLINRLFNGKYNTTSFDNFIKKISIGDFKSLKRILFPKQLEQLDNLVKTGELEKYKQTQQTESKILIKKLLREGLVIENEGVNKEEFFQQNNIDPEELSHMGNGDFGDAYSIGDGRVLKITRSKSEFDFAKELAGKDVPALDGFVNFYVANIVNNQYYIIMEELEEDYDIEDMYYQVQELLSHEGLPIQYLHMLDTDELDLDEDILSFISDIEDINHSYRYLGIEASDIKPDNLGVDRNGKVKAFDIDDRSINEIYK